MNFHLKSVVTTRIADTETPVGIYLKLRDQFAETLLLEHSVPAGTEGGFSYICCEPIAGIHLSNNTLTKKLLDRSILEVEVTPMVRIVNELDSFISSFSIGLSSLPFAVDGFFGYFSYNAVQYFEDISITAKSNVEKIIPDIRLNIYRYIVVFDHFRNEISIVHIYNDERDRSSPEVIEDLLSSEQNAVYPFKVSSDERSNFTDEEFLNVIECGKQHCYKGDVFQVVLSREFESSFLGDDLNVYRALRSINPSPYLFYFDYGDYKLFGASPEAQLKIKDGKATVHPIAGTYRRTGIAEEDAALMLALLADEKENAEHVMLIDVARNDLSKNYSNVKVPVYKNIQKFSHVLHIVSEVTGEDPVGNDGPIKVLADTFPAGTLSGAPKYKAMELIDKYENNSRGFYGGSVGFTSFGGDFNHAIMIRSFLSKNNKLYYRAGAGIVAASIPKSELEEINNKVAALRKAIQTANTF